jgi:hypothetical protein
VRYTAVNLGVWRFSKTGRKIVRQIKKMPWSVVFHDLTIGLFPSGIAKWLQAMSKILTDEFDTGQTQAR